MRLLNSAAVPRLVAILAAPLLLLAACAHPIHISPLHLAHESPFIAVTVHDCHDGDTCTVTLTDPWLPPVFGHQISVRLRGIDTPEMHSHCTDERTRASAARRFLIDKISHAIRVDLVMPQRDKYFRLLATVHADGEDLSAALLRAGLAHPYHGGTKIPWC